MWYYIKIVCDYKSHTIYIRDYPHAWQRAKNPRNTRFLGYLTFGHKLSCDNKSIFRLYYSIIVATLLIVWHTVVFIVFLVRFYTMFYYSLYYLYVFLKIIKCILSAWVSWFLTFKYQIFNLDFHIIFFPVIYKYY